ncbi:uncharacterized protein N7498_005713 [Penicillium cinerascens]|uniref:Orotidine 5'-phosphate decarboxylase domain-containing protein n=1 Tax=Penicillium cinerascens TaxID=70096 RepID=A0A9W9MP29_9EURO|nr:uncharacterized protein N7498_005713 [Penicillium cinerascens]KAJ5204834.1 hypothetical protein N7498_005713 [Penicillium cinerascens]
MSVTDSSPDNEILEYIQKLAETKKALPYGQPICALASHTITDTESLVQLAEEVGPHIAILQIQAHIIDDWSNHTIDQLTYLSKKHGFILWEGSRVLNSLVNFMCRDSTNWEQRKVLADVIKRNYTNGPVKVGRWAGMATAWAPGAPVDKQEEDVLIPTLRKAAREAVASTYKTIQTEISAADNEDCPEGDATEEITTTNGWPEFSSNNGISMRKSSTISVTETITMQPHIQPEDGVPPPPFLARGLVLSLPSAGGSAFTPEFRQSTIAAACSNRDFVVGFLSSEPFFTEYHGNNVMELAILDGRQGAKGRNLLASSHLLEKQNPLGLFSLIPPELAANFESDPVHILKGDVDSPEAQPESVMKLYYIVRQALRLRDANRKDKEANKEETHIRSGPNIVHFPMVILP